MSLAQFRPEPLPSPRSKNRAPDAQPLLEKRLYSYQEAADYQRVAYGTVAYARDALKRMARAGELRIVGTKGKHLIPRAEIDRLLEGDFVGAR